MYISPRTTSRRTVCFRRSGIVFIVLTFAVTFSPTKPSPRVAPVTSRPFSYVSDTESPSIFFSTTKLTSSSGKDSMILRQNCFTSSSENTLSRLCRGMTCVNFSKPSDTAPPTRCVGESGVMSSGCAVSRDTSSLYKASYSKSDTAG